MLFRSLRPAAAYQGGKQDADDLHVRVDHHHVAADDEVDAAVHHDEHGDVEDDRNDEVREGDPKEESKTVRI